MTQMKEYTSVKCHQTASVSPLLSVMSAFHAEHLVRGCQAVFLGTAPTFSDGTESVIFFLCDSGNSERYNFEV